jgi:DNA sulfur modification protein DndE
MKRKSLLLPVLFSIALVFFYNCDSNKVTDGFELTKAQRDTVEIATQAYLAGFPLIIMESTKNQFINPEVLVNQFAVQQKFISASDTSVVRPNVDTYYSIAFLDLTKGPQKFHMPSTIVDGVTKYYMMPMLDAYTNVFKSPGTRTGYVNGGDYLIVGPDSTQNIYENDDDIDEVFQAPTNLVWILGRFEVDNEQDSVIVAGLQEQFTLSPYEAQTSTSVTTPVRNILKYEGDLPSPNQIINNMSIEAFFNQMNHLLPENPLSPFDSSLTNNLATIGVGIGTPFNLNSFSSNVQQALNDIPQKVITSINDYYDNGNGEKGWTVNIDSLMGNYGTNYFLRAVISYEGLGANQIEDAVYYANSYDSKGNQLDGSNDNKYILTFRKGEKPPIDAFWSLTMYKENGNLYENDIKRYVLGHNTDEPFYYEPDSTLILYLQHEQPNDPKLINNWLPAPDEAFNVLLRAYYPEKAILNKSWNPTDFIKRKK